MDERIKTPNPVPKNPESYLHHWFTTTMTPLRLDFYKNLEKWTAEVTLEFSKGQVARLLEKLRELMEGLESGKFQITAVIDKQKVQELISFIESLDYQNRILAPEDIQLIETEFNNLFLKGSYLL